MAAYFSIYSPLSAYYGGFLLPEKSLLFERFKANIFLFVILKIAYDKEKKGFETMQSNESTNHGVRGVVLQTPKQM